MTDISDEQFPFVRPAAQRFGDFQKLCDSLREIKNAISLQASEKIDVETKKLIDKKVVIDYSSPNIANASMSAIFAR